jgi:hypothetical protein
LFLREKMTAQILSFEKGLNWRKNKQEKELNTPITLVEEERIQMANFLSLIADRQYAPEINMFIIHMRDVLLGSTRVEGDFEMILEPQTIHRFPSMIDKSELQKIAWKILKEGETIIKRSPD